MKMNRTTISVSISLFSSLILGSMLTQQVKADPTDQQPTTAVSPTNGDTVQNKNVEGTSDSKPASVASQTNNTITQASAVQATTQNPVTPQAEDDSENISITFEYVDTEGKELLPAQSITTYQDDQLYLYETIEDPSSFAPTIPGYTYAQNTQPITVTSSNNIVKLIYTNDSLNYLAVNYTDTGKGTGADTGLPPENDKIVYTDYLLGNSGDTVNIKDINDLNSHYEMSNSSNTGTYTIKSDKESLPIYVDPAPFHGSVVQTTKSKIILNNNFTLKRGAQPIYSKIKLFSYDVNKVENLVTSSVTGSVNFNKLWDSTALAQATNNFEIDLLDLIKVYVSTTISEDQTGATATFAITYKPNIPDNDKTVTATYQTADGTSVGEPITLTNTTGSDIEASDLLTQSLPTGYEFINTDDPYTIDSVTDDNVALISKIQKTPQKPVTPGNSGNSSNNSGSSDHDTGEVTGIEENISTHPNLTAINVYDDNGNLTDETVAPNTDFSTDEKLQLDGKTYYRIAQNKWVNADDIYIHYTDPTYVRTYNDSAKELVNSQDKTVSDRELAAGSNWYSDRYTYLNDQKYYRVATNELVSAKDAFEYQPINQVVQPSDNARLFDDRGNFVKSAPKVSLKTDKIATINGIKMYRVATNEWLPVNEVK